MTKGLKSPNIHNVWLKGRYTSISVEPDFWEQFRLIVIERRTTISNLLAEIERTMRLLPDQGKGCDRTLTLSAAVRVFVLRTVMSRSSSRRGALAGDRLDRRGRYPKGGWARADKMSAAERAEIARKPPPMSRCRRSPPSTSRRQWPP